MGGREQASGAAVGVVWFKASSVGAVRRHAPRRSWVTPHYLKRAPPDAATQHRATK